MRARVFWHGLFPDIDKQGVIVRHGTIRHEVLWNGEAEVSLVDPRFLMYVSRYPKCCEYCQSKVRSPETESGPAYWRDGLRVSE